MLSPPKYFYDTKNINNTIIVAGVGRSGTTLLAETINYDNQFRLMFEPFNKYKVKALSELNYRLYIPHLNNDEKLKEKYYKILSGDLRNSWVDQYNKKLFCNKRIIKEIRINQSLKWVKLNFPEIPIVYIVRHPCAVTLSKLRLNWDDHLFEYIGQIELVNDHLKPYIDIINSAKTAYEKHLIMWCIENSIVLNSFKEKEISIIFYEHLITHPVKSMEKIYKYLNLNFNNKIIDTLSKPSLQANPQSAISRAKNIINDWTNYVDDKQKQYTKNILNEYNLDQLYTLDPLPSINENDDPLFKKY